MHDTAHIRPAHPTFAHMPTPAAARDVGEWLRFGDCIIRHFAGTRRGLDVRADIEEPDELEGDRPEPPRLCSVPRELLLRLRDDEAADVEAIRDDLDG